jgi:hypothetical protein
MEPERDTAQIRVKKETRKDFNKIVFNSKQNDDNKFDSIHKIIDFMFNSLKDKSPLKDYLK